MHTTKGRIPVAPVVIIICTIFFLSYYAHSSGIISLLHCPCLTRTESGQISAPVKRGRGAPSYTKPDDPTMPWIGKPF